MEETYCVCVYFLGPTYTYVVRVGPVQTARYINPHHRVAFFGTLSSHFGPFLCPKWLFFDFSVLSFLFFLTVFFALPFLLRFENLSSQKTVRGRPDSLCLSLLNRFSPIALRYALAIFLSFTDLKTSVPKKRLEGALTLSLLNRFSPIALPRPITEVKQR